MEEEYMTELERQQIDKFISILEQENINKVECLDYILKEAKKLIAVGEYKIALENLLSNLDEQNIIVNKDTLKSLNEIEDKDIKYLLAFSNEQNK